jgi:hypothetical protein
MSRIIRWLQARITDWTGFCYGLHFFCSAVLVILGVSWLKATPLQAAGIALSIGFGKEAYDVLIAHKTGDVIDIICNIAGCLVGYLLVLGK